MITLRENINKAKNLIQAIDSLSNPGLYGYGFKTDSINHKHLRKTVKNFKRLVVVIDKQIKDGARDKFKETTSQSRSRQLNTIFKT